LVGLKIMEIALIYSKGNTDHLKTANLVRKAVRSLGISATITEVETDTPSPQLVVDGFDLTGLLEQPGRGTGDEISYDSVLKLLESIAW